MKSHNPNVYDLLRQLVASYSDHPKVTLTKVNVGKHAGTRCWCRQFELFDQPSQPAILESRTPQPSNDIGACAHQAPEQISPVILTH